MAESNDRKPYPDIDVNKEAMASLVGMYMQNFVFRRAVRNAKDDGSLRTVLDEYGYRVGRDLSPVELEAVLDFHRQTVRNGLSDEEVYEVLIGPPGDDRITHLRG
jgi:hypothetical protein